jgi:hypothetical protein
MRKLRRVGQISLVKRNEEGPPQSGAGKEGKR